jgi:preprotein translocase subunit SecD
MGRRAALITVLVTLAIVWGSLAAVLATGTTPKLGLDLQGGFRVVLEAPEGTDAGVLEKAVEVMTRRIEALGGVQEPVLKIVDDRDIEVELPGVTDRDRARAAVGTTGQLEFRPVLEQSPYPGISPLVVAAEEARALQESLEGLETTTTTVAGDDASTTSTTSSTTTTTTTTIPEETEPLDLSTVLPEGTVLCDVDAEEDELAAHLAGQPGCVDPVSGFTLSDDPLAEAWLFDPETGAAYHVAPACSLAVWNYGEGECVDARLDPDAAEGTPEQALLGADLAGAERQFRSTGGSTGPIGVGSSGVGEWIVVLDFTGAGAGKFETITKELAAFAPGDPQRQFAIVLDGDVISAPQMAPEITSEEGISGGTAVITLGASPDPEQEADDLAIVLRYGALPVSFVESTSSEVSATLGSDSLSAGLVAGFGGLILVALAMILYYRALGLVNVIGLAVFGSAVFVVFGVLGATGGVTLTLAGVAGVVVSIGITSDSYIVYFERIKEEVHRGRSLRSAIDHAFSRAFRTILTADTVSLFAAGLLYFLAIGQVKGFALALGIATAADIVIAYFYTRPAVALVARSRFGEGGTLSIRGATGGAREAEVES